MAQKFQSVLTENASAWNIPADDVAGGLTTKASTYETTYEAGARTVRRRSFSIKNENQDALKANVRNIKTKYMDYNDAVTNPARERLDLPIRDQNPTPKPKPMSHPTLEVLPINSRQHIAAAINQATGTKTKPEDAYGAHGEPELDNSLQKN
ncbi:MAG: hypothetical protein LBD79_08975 [Treponema sp.]|jgi:hypothetical protein|nr:hypothetical protein [Treponema sp.]